MDIKKKKKLVIARIVSRSEVELSEAADIGFSCSQMEPLVNISVDDARINLTFQYDLDLDDVISDLYRSMPDLSHDREDARRSEEDYYKDELMNWLKNTEFSIDDSEWSGDTLFLHVSQFYTEKSPDDIHRILQIARQLKDGIK